MKTNIIIFGITGDLSKKKLLPSLDKLINLQMIEKPEIIGISRRSIDINDVIASSDIEDKENTYLKNAKIQMLDLSNLHDYIELSKFLDIKKNNDDQFLFYLSVPANAAIEITSNLGKANLNKDNVKILIEKPFGTSLDSAKDYFDQINKYFREPQIYRIDHYLAKSSSNSFIEWKEKNIQKLNTEFVEKIEVIGVEKIGIEGRSVFFEQTGTLRDFIQNHLTEWLALVLCKKANDKQQLSLNRSKIIQTLSLNKNECIRGQYTTYKHEVGNENSFVETFANIELSSSADEWKNVRINLISGKSLNEKTSSVKIYFKNGEVFEFDINKKYPSDVKESAYYLDAYELVFLNALNNDKAYFAGYDEIINSWTLFQPLLDEWLKDGKDLIIYQNGSNYSDIKKIVF